MAKTLKDKISDKLVNAFLKNKIISPIPSKFTKKLTEADKFRKFCESKIKDPIIGFKAGGTGIPLMKKLKEKEPFIASVFNKNLIKSGKKVKINKSTLGIELEVCYLISLPRGKEERCFFYRKALGEEVSQVVINLRVKIPCILDLNLKLINLDEVALI